MFTLAPQQAEVRRGIRSLGPVTRAELANALSIRIPSICARVNELLEMGAVRENIRTRECRVTGYTAHALRA